MTKDVVDIALNRSDRGTTQEGALLPILRDLQEEFGHLPEPVFPRVAETFNLSAPRFTAWPPSITISIEAARRAYIMLCRAEAC